VILAAELVENRPANPRCREGAEGETAIRLEALQRRHQSERAGAHEFIELELDAEAARHLSRDEVDESEVLVEQRLAS
jgi:hypothetical protein